MTKNTQYIIAGGLALVGGIFFWINYQDKKRKEEYARLLRQFQQQNGTNFIPNRNSPEWQQWVQYAIGAYGFAKTLWEPGGIFYKTNVPDYMDTNFWDQYNLPA